MLFNSTVYQIGGGELTAVETKLTGPAVSTPIPDGATKLLSLGTAYTDSTSSSSSKGYRIYEKVNGQWSLQEDASLIRTSFSETRATFVNSYNPNYSLKVTAIFLIPT